MSLRKVDGHEKKGVLTTKGGGTSLGTEGRSVGDDYLARQNNGETQVPQLSKGTKSMGGATTITNQYEKKSSVIG